MLAGCETAPPGPRPLVQIITPGPGAPNAASYPAPFGRSKARWVSAAWQELPGWHGDDLSQAWSALLASCARPAPEAAAAWAGVCAGTAGVDGRNAQAVRRWMQERLQPWRLEAGDGRTEGLLTGYFEPLVEARRRPTPAYRTPLHAPPADLAPGQPWYSRAEAGSHPAAQAALRGRELVYVADPLDALMLQIQGSGRVRVLDEPDAQGRPRLLRLAFAAHNGQPYQSIGRWLVDRGELAMDQASWPAIRAWARLHPERIDELLNVNPRLVFFREEPLTDAGSGPLGAQGVPLTPGRSIAVDREAVPLGTPVWIVSTEPQPWSRPEDAPPPRPLQRLVLAQDTGGAIQGPVRADFFWGWGDGIEQQAGRTRQPLRMWALWPRS